MIQAALVKGFSRLRTKAGQWVTFGWRLWRGIRLEAGMMEMGLLWREWWAAFDGEESSGKSGENGKRSLIQGLDLGGLEAVTFPWLTWVRQKSREGTRRATRKCWWGWGGAEVKECLPRPCFFWNTASPGAGWCFDLRFHTGSQVSLSI